jgi:hypothetical protein
MVARVIAGVVGLFYLVTGAWSFLFPAHFYAAVATFAPYNLHLLHDVGAFQFGLGAVLVAATVSRIGLVPALVGVLAGSFLHFLAHLFDFQLGGHPTTDLPALALIVILLSIALYLALRRPRASSHQ